MIGLLFFGALFLYILICLLLAWFASWVADRRGVAGWKVGLPVFIGLLMLVFWDWLPMEVSFAYDCGKYAGYTQYQTLAQWKKENPGVAETLRPSNNLRSTREGNRERYLLNQRFAWDIIRKPHWFHIREQDERIVDTKTGKILARYVDFSTDIPPITYGVKSPGAYKIWMAKESCEVGNGIRTKPTRFKFSKFMYLLQHQREYEK